MKLRIRGNSLRLRLTRGEVAALRTGDMVSEETAFPGGNSLEYRLCAVAGLSRCEADFDGKCIRVSLPAAAAHDWADSDAVTIESIQSTAGGAEFLVLVEKDFACLAERPHEDDSDAFPHPEA